MANSASSAPLTPPTIPPTFRHPLFDIFKDGFRLPHIQVINDRLAQFEFEINEIRRETATNFTNLDHRLDDMGNDIKQLADAATQIGLTLRNVQGVLLTQHRRAQLADHRSSLYRQHESLIRRLDIARNPEQENAIEAQLDTLSTWIDEADEQLTEIDQVITSSLATPNHLPRNPMATFSSTSDSACPPSIPIAPKSAQIPKRKQMDQVVSRWKGPNDVASSNDTDSLDSRSRTRPHSIGRRTRSTLSPHLFVLGDSKPYMCYSSLYLLHDLRSLIHSFFVSFVLLPLSVLCRSLYSELTFICTFLEAVPYVPKLILFLFLFSSSVMAANLGPSCASSSFLIYAINANGMHHVLKLIHINNAIGHRNPSAFVISELKSSTSTAGQITLKNYNIFEERSQPTTGTWKWGVILGIRDDIQVVQRLAITKAILKSRVLAVNVALSDVEGNAFLHRVFAVYAPWNPGSDSAEFWVSLTDLCNSTPHSWSLAGDLNATVSSIKRASSGEDNRRFFLEFLENANAQDLWQKNPERSCRNDWTCRARDQDRGGNIIDRVVTSSHGILDTHIHAAASPQDYIPVTDHRPICAYIVPTPKIGSYVSRETLNPQLKVSRIRYPKASEKGLFRSFEADAEEMADQMGLFRINVDNEASWLRLYKGLTRVLIKCAERHFGRNKTNLRISMMANVTSPMIQALRAEQKHIGGALYLC
ncbi:hypothetical protein EDD18DRAFT_1417512 [Armillaria luteobubalina]|uniref:Endonuclease/exonuclease/phosphatase domain-containing protein n=1 Tax=Armillaria luteobubalina TaxID=153913 RepID=A0AA39PSY2_9AGAR|nr:hypothetical protein EDD18DRAFT_1417512 [Armillaria luteobubalina]